jgi:hypothetical protein
MTRLSKGSSGYSRRRRLAAGAASTAALVAAGVPALQSAGATHTGTWGFAGQAPGLLIDGSLILKSKTIADFGRVKGIVIGFHYFCPDGVNAITSSHMHGAFNKKHKFNVHDARGDSATGYYTRSALHLTVKHNGPPCALKVSGVLAYEHGKLPKGA